MSVADAQPTQDAARGVFDIYDEVDGLPACGKCGAVCKVCQSTTNDTNVKDIEYESTPLTEAPEDEQFDEVQQYSYDADDLASPSRAPPSAAACASACALLPQLPASWCDVKVDAEVTRAAAALDSCVETDLLVKEKQLKNTASLAARGTASDTHERLCDMPLGLLARKVLRQLQPT